jgi:N6-adenosine-specific RNA methylase IME4
MSEPSSGALVKYETARRALAEAHSVDAVKDIRDKAEAMRLYARQAQDHELLWWAAEIKVRAERRAGELLPDLIEHGGDKARSQVATLRELGISKSESSRWQQAAAYPEPDFEVWLDDLKGRSGAIPTSSALRNLVKITHAKAANRQQRGDTVADLRALAESGRTFAGILADPAWRYRTWSERGTGRGAGMHYRTMSLEEIIAMAPLVQSLAARDCVLLMWVAWPHLLEAGQVIEAWGFRYSTCGFDWAKLNPSGEGWHMGNGKWTRANTEPCLLASRGSPPRFGDDVRQLIVAPVGEHSSKPEEVHERIERLVPGPYLELFARRPRDGWTVWGNEAPDIETAP